MRKPTLTVAIPAFNEETNIAALLEDLLSQHCKTITLDSIIVLSDGSTDNTVRNAKKVKSKKIVVIDSKERRGRGARQNEMMEASESDLFVVLDADIVITDKDYLDTLVKPIILGRADLTSSSLLEMKGETAFARVLCTSMDLKRVLFSTFRNGNNAYNCHGPSRAFSKRLYKKMHFTANDGEDMFSYLSCIKEGYPFLYVPDTCVYYWVPTTLQDHLKQSIRYLGSQKNLAQEFSTVDVAGEVKFPISTLILAGIRALPIIATRPVDILWYFWILLYVKFHDFFHKAPEVTWGVASTKNVRSHDTK
jgi:glycosyltransferase involved in cell wall biosynthesis